MTSKEIKKKKKQVYNQPKQHKKFLYTDSHSVIQSVRNSVYHSKTKHRRRYHFTHRLVENGNLFGEDRGCKELNKHVEKIC